MMNDNDLDRLLNTLDCIPSPDRVRNLRRSILISAPPRRRMPFFLFGFRPALLTATALLGLVLGMSLPLLGPDDASTGFLDLPSQSFLGDSFG
jgi:hypothetical protein